MDADAYNAPAPFALGDALVRLQDGDFEVEYEVPLDTLDGAAQRATVDRAVDAIAESPTAIGSQQLFDTVASCVKHAPALSNDACHALLDSVASGMSAVLEEIRGEQGAELLPYLERYAFLLQWLVQMLEKNSAPSESKAAKRAVGGAANTWTWATSVPLVLALMAKVLETAPEHLWATGTERDAFFGRCIVRPVLLLQENEAYVKVPSVKHALFRVICLAVKHHGQAFNVQTSIEQSLQYYEHLSEPMAELLCMMRVEYDYERLCEDVLREVGSKSFAGIDSKTPRSFSRFLVRMAELNPRSVLKQMSLLQTHLDSEAYPIRIAMVEVLGHMIRELTLAEDEFEPSEEGETSARDRQIAHFYDLLLERFLDLTTFVRTRVIHVCNLLCELPAKFPAQRMRIATLAAQSLEDKGSNVRRSAIGLLTQLVLTHPFGMMHGGELNGPVWEQRYAAVDKELGELEAALAMPDETPDTTQADAPSPPQKRKPRQSFDPAAIAASQQSMTAADRERLMRLRLTKRYYEDALTFIHLLDAAVPTLVQLLGSTNKAEVLESMEFFRIAHEYRIRGASMGVRTMLHLIWAKDNALVMEDGSQLKGIRSRLIEVYRALYFDPDPDAARSENIVRIARNMVELTYGATLAELTSLEQLLSIMQGEGLVPPAVVDTLWDVFSTPKTIARPQRRGAIVVIGMLAIADRDIVAERVEVLLRIGLGQLGTQDLQLARHTCIALQRVAGSAKKVKGALSDSNVRYPMAHPIFARLSAAITQKVSARAAGEWFGVAEHAIQALYLLGEQPDALASEILRELTVDVFDNGGSSVRLAQLVFVVGHIALKQIVYLELVEREFKRRKALRDAEVGGENRRTELDQVAGSAEDEIGDMIAAIKERELLYGPHSILALYGPLVVHICTNPNAYPDALLQRAAALTLSKLLCISSEFCEEYLGVLLQLLRTSADAVVRSNVVIGLGDVAVCFGMLIDENSGRLYAGLGDSNLGVKKNTLMVLTHLILNGMIKVKGQLGEMAKCLEDPERRVSDLAKLFFSELATKENAVYNNLPDIISHLSIGEHAVSEEMFVNTMRFIFTFIDKERQAENVIEKLCQRCVYTDPASASPQRSGSGVISHSVSRCCHIAASAQSSASSMDCRATKTSCTVQKSIVASLRYLPRFAPAAAAHKARWETQTCASLKTCSQPRLPRASRTKLLKKPTRYASRAQGARALSRAAKRVLN